MKNVTPSRSSIAETADSWRRHASAQMIVKPAAIPGICGPRKVSAPADDDDQQQRPQAVEHHRARPDVGHHRRRLGVGQQPRDRRVDLVAPPEPGADQRRHDPPAGRRQRDLIVLVARGGDERQHAEGGGRAAAEQHGRPQEVDEPHRLRGARQRFEHGAHAERAVDEQVGGLLELRRRLVGAHADADRLAQRAPPRPRRAGRRRRRGRCGRRRRRAPTSTSVSLSRCATPRPLVELHRRAHLEDLAAPVR